MKKYILACCLILSISGPSFAETIFRVAYRDKGTPPYYNGDGQSIPSKNPGLVIELINLIGEKLDLDVRYVRKPWADVLTALQKNEVDAIFDASFVPARQIIGRYPMEQGQPVYDKALYKRNYSLFVMKDSTLKWNGIHISALERPIAAKKDFSILRDLEIRRIKTVSVETRLEGYAKLKAGEISAFADLEIEGDAFIANYWNGFQDIRKIRRPLKSKYYYLMLSHGFYDKNRDLAEAIWNEIPNMLNNRAMHEIRRDYNY
ncbi:MAG: transporter substrate-binding domain-containing protein [Methylocystaceae bacterium]|nr:transporter substrate-binding domain-containing protein [Methylocystaceae bacterium]